MINDLANAKGLQSVEQHLGASEVTPSIKAKEVRVALSKIQIGDLLQGQLIVEDEQAMLKLESGLKLFANLPTNVVLNKELAFWVIGKERQHLVLELAQIQEGQKSMISLTDQTIDELGVKDTPEMRQVIEQFVGKQLPLVKEQLLQLLHFARSYDIPTETLINLVSQKQVPRQEELELLVSLKEQGIKALMPAFDDLIETLSSKQSAEMARAFFDLLRPHEVKEALKQVFKQPNTSDVEVVRWQTTLNKLFDEVVQFSTHDQLNKLNKALIHESLVVHLKSIEKEAQGEIEKVTELDRRLKQVEKVMEEVVTDSSEKTHLQTLESAIEVLDKYRMQGQYWCFPFQVKEHHTTGELYFFKSNKQKARQEQGLYVVLALTMPALNKVEVHLVEKSEQFNLKIKVENEAIKKQLEQYENVLLETMKSSGTPIEKIVVELLSEKRQNLAQDTSAMLCHLDLKI